MGKKIGWAKYWLVFFITLVMPSVRAAVSGSGGTVSFLSDFSLALGGAVSVNGNVVTLTDDVNLNNTLVINTDVIFDLNNHKLSFVREEDKALIALQCKSGTITIKNGQIEGKQTKGSWASAYGTAIDIQSNAIVTIFNCDVLGHSQGNWGGDGTAIQYYGGTLRLISGTFDASTNRGSAYALWTSKGNIANFRYGSVIKKNGAIQSSGATVGPVVTVSPIKYLIIYDIQSGTFTSTDYVKEYTIIDIVDKNVAPLASVSKKGYYFNGWKYNSTIVDRLSLPHPNEDKEEYEIVLTADWSPIDYTIQYDMQGGTNVSDNYTSYDISKGVVSLKNPSPRTGYEFSGWFDSGGNKITSITYDAVKNAPNKTYTITARWSLIEYTINFDVAVNGGKKSITYNVTTTDNSLPNPDATPEGMQFAGWYSGSTKFETIPVSNPSNLSLTAKWKEIDYHAFFYDGSNKLDKLTQAFTVSTGLSSFPNYEKDGYVFEHWRDKPANGTIVTSIPVGTKEDRSFYAEWTPIRYTLTYQLNGGTYTGTNPVSYLYSNKASLPGDQAVTRTGYIFEGWYINGNRLTEAPVSGGTIAEGGRIMTFTTEAKWRLNKYSIQFRTDGGTTVADEEYSVEAGIPADKMPTTSRPGYDFDGWYLGQEKVTSIAPGSKELILVAHWKIINYPITYTLNGGTNPSDAPTSYDYEHAQPLPKKPTRQHYNFEGWFLDDACTNSAGGEIIKNSTGAKNFYAKWSPKKYTITFVTNGGSPLNPQVYTYGEETKFKNRTRKENYDYAWYKDEALTLPFGDKISATTGGDFTLYAKWTPTVYKIEYDCYYGQNPASAPTSYTIAIEKDLPLPTPVREGYSFGGWYDNDMLNGEKKTIIKVGESGHKKFFATWKRTNAVLYIEPQNGKIIVKQGDTVLKSGDRVGANVSLTVSAEGTTAGYVLKSLIIGGVSYTSSPQTVTMPEENGLVMEATFHDASPAASAPKITTDPENTDNLFVGSTVMVTLQKTDNETTLSYSLDGSTPKPYTGPFQVSSSTARFATVKAIASKPGYKDGVSTREIGFGVKKITITFDLPEGVTATNPQGGEVVSAIASGSFFEFVLQVNANLFQSVDSMKVLANDSLIVPTTFSVYRLTNQTKDVKVKVTGLKKVAYKITLRQSGNGQIHFTKDEGTEPLTVSYGDTVSVTAVPEPDFKFGGWKDGVQENPYVFKTIGDTTLEARFVSDVKYYTMTLPVLEGVTVKPLTTYSTEVKRGEKFKFYLRLSSGYHVENLVVRANGKVLEVNQEVYSLYDVTQNYSISVEGVVRDKAMPKLAEHVSATSLDTGSDAAKLLLYPESMLTILATAPSGQRFYKWNDGKGDNPRVVTVREASELVPLFVSVTGTEAYARVSLPAVPGAGMGLVNSDIYSVAVGGDLQLKLVLLPGYSQSDVKVTANGKIVEADLTLRASSSARTLFYTLSGVSDELKVEVGGLRLNTHEVGMERPDGGQASVTPSGKVAYGQVVTFTATPETGKMFLKWSDGNTLNPYPYTVTGDVRMKAIFLKSDSPVTNDDIVVDEAMVMVDGYTLRLNLAKASPVYIYAYDGRLVYSGQLPAGVSQIPVKAGEWIIRIGDKTVFKRFIR